MGMERSTTCSLPQISVMRTVSRSKLRARARRPCAANDEQRRLHRSAAIGSALVLFIQVANAQAPAAQNTNESGLETVTVTATKQAEAVDVNKVPISISAYGQRELDTRGVKDIGDIAAIT